MIRPMLRSAIGFLGRDGRATRLVQDQILSPGRSIAVKDEPLWMSTNPRNVASVIVEELHRSAFCRHGFTFPPRVGHYITRTLCIHGIVHGALSDSPEPGATPW